MIVSPPSCRIPTSNDTRVRVEAFSKIMARTLPSKGLLPGSPAFSLAFRSFASSRMPRSSAADNVERSRKWRGVVIICLCLACCHFSGAGYRLGGIPDAQQRFLDLVFRHRQRGKKAQDVIASRSTEDFLCDQSFLHAAAVNLAA